jgi:DNA recombination protein RmuC
VLELALLGAGLLLGGALAWAVARVRLGTGIQAERAGLQARVAALEMLTDELRKQLSQRDLETGDLRAALAGERTARAQAETRAETARQSLDEQRQTLEEARTRLADTFKALSAEALQQNQSAFLEMATSRLVQSQQAIDATVRPLQDALTRYEDALRGVEAARERAYGSLEEQLRALTDSSGALQREAGNLVTALRTPQVRGRWGELTLRRVAELAGMTAHCDFVEQLTVSAEGGRLRPDMIVRLPAERQIIVDAKVPLAAYLDGLAAATPEERRAAQERHARQVRAHMQALSDKAYWEQFEGTLDFVVMFIPGESFFGAAVETDPALIDDAMARRVMITTPMTLIALLRSVELGWTQHRLATDAQKVSEEGHELYKRVTIFLEHFADVGAALGRATGAYNKAVGSMESRVLPSARRLKELVATSGDEPPALDVIEAQPRQLAVPEFPTQPSLPPETSA